MLQLKQKLKQCFTLFSFSEDSLLDVDSKDIKRDALIEITEYLDERPQVVTVSLIPTFIRMVLSLENDAAANVTRFLQIYSEAVPQHEKSMS